MKAGALIAGALLLLGCAAHGAFPAATRDYSLESAYYNREPRTIIVLPAMNETTGLVT